MMVVNRFRADEADGADGSEGFRDELTGALGVLAAQTGYVDGQLGRSLDDPGLWVMVTRWRDVGSYRRALSSYDVKVGVVPLLSRAIDEPSAFEPLDGELNTSSPRVTG